MARKKVAPMVSTELDLSSMSVDEKIVALWGQGWSQRQIGAETGLATGTISYRIARGRRLGLDLPARTSPIQAPSSRQEVARPSTPTAVPAPPEPLPQVRASDRHRTCQFILQLRCEGGLRKCDQPIDGRTAYCAEHRETCHMPHERKADRPGYSPKIVPAGRFGSMGDNL